MAFSCPLANKAALGTNGHREGTKREPTSRRGLGQSPKAAKRKPTPSGSPHPLPAPASPSCSAHSPAPCLPPAPSTGPGQDGAAPAGHFARDSSQEAARTQAAVGGGGRDASGLVSSKTSQTLSPSSSHNVRVSDEVLELETRELRMKGMRKAILTGARLLESGFQSTGFPLLAPSHARP